MLKIFYQLFQFRIVDTSIVSIRFIVQCIQLTVNPNPIQSNPIESFPPCPPHIHHTLLFFIFVVVVMCFFFFFLSSFLPFFCFLFFFFFFFLLLFCNLFINFPLSYLPVVKILFLFSLLLLSFFLLNFNLIISIIILFLLLPFTPLGISIYNIELLRQNNKKELT